MARNDGIDRTLARNRDLSANDIKNAQAHNEREEAMMKAQKKKLKLYSR